MSKKSKRTKASSRPLIAGVPAEWAGFVSDVLAWCAHKFCQEGALQGMAFLGKIGEEQISVVPIDAQDEASKDASTEMIAEVALQTQAGAILCVLEAWTLREAHMRDAQALIKRYGSLSAMPDTMKEEVLMASLETPMGMWVARASIARDDRAKSVQVGPFHFEFMPGTIGRFTHLLPASPASTTLH